MKLSNELPASAFHTNPEVRVSSVRSPDIRWSWWNSPDIILDTITSSETPTIANLSGLTVVLIAKDARIGGFLLKSILLVQLKRTQDEVLSETWLEGVYEYGSGQDDSAAITDLVISLGEYRRTLEKRGKKLGDATRRELDALRRLIEPAGPELGEQ